METPPHPKRRRLLVACALIVLFLAPAALWGRTALKQWQFKKTVQSARASLQSNQLRGAVLGARQALTIQPNGVEPLRIMVEAADRIRSPEVILWQQRLSDARGNPPEELFALARFAMQFNETFIAGEALGRIPDSARTTVAFHEIAAALAAKSGRHNIAEEHLKAALALEPANTERQVGLAAIQLVSGEPAVAEKARTTLDSFATDARWRVAVLRTLVGDARRNQEHERARSLAQQLAAIPGVPIEDQLLAIETLRPVDEAAFYAALKEFQERSKQEPGLIFNLMRWMNAQGLATESTSWFSTLPVSVQTQMPVPLVAAEAFEKTKQWKALQRLVSNSQEDWGGLEFLRRAYRARAAVTDTGRLQGATFQLEWDRAVQATAGNLGSMWVLARLVRGWEWKQQAAQVWWMLANRPAGQRDALKELFKLYKESGDTAKLYEVVKRVAEVESGNPVARNNKAMISFLVGQDLEEAHRLATELYRYYPAEPAVSSTYAMSLLKKGEEKEALAALERLSAEARGKMPLAFYYALIVAANGRINEVKPILTEALNDRSLLPEEKQLAESFVGKP